MLIDASLIADGVGPGMPLGTQVRCHGDPGLYIGHDDVDVWWAPLYDCEVGMPQSVEWRDCTFTLEGGVAFELARKLDAWEKHGDMQRPRGMTTYFWRQATLGGREDRLQAMHARLTHIGLDHRIRRALEWQVEPGTLAVLTWERDTPASATKAVRLYAAIGSATFREFTGERYLSANGPEALAAIALEVT